MSISDVAKGFWAEYGEVVGGIAIGIFIGIILMGIIWAVWGPETKTPEQVIQANPDAVVEFLKNGDRSSEQVLNEWVESDDLGFKDLVTSHEDSLSDLFEQYVKDNRDRIIQDWLDQQPAR